MSNPPTFPFRKGGDKKRIRCQKANKFPSFLKRGEGRLLKRVFIDCSTMFCSNRENQNQLKYEKGLFFNVIFDELFNIHISYSIIEQDHIQLFGINRHSAQYL